MKHSSIAEQIRAQRVERAYEDMSAREINYQYQEDFFQGFLEGISKGGQLQCQDGLTLFIWSIYQAIEYREAYLPWETIKLAIALAKLNESSNTIYAFCNFD